ncbi:MAG: tetratricopeptide repeat protein [Magnetococcus sp. THC-1_WYH]
MTRSVIVLAAIMGWFVAWHTTDAQSATNTVSDKNSTLPKVSSQVPATTAELFKRSYALETAGRYVEAAEVILPLHETRNGDQELVMLRLGWLNYLQGQHNVSIHYYRLALRTNGRSIDALLGITLPLLAQQRYRETAAFAGSVLELSHLNQTALQRMMVATEGQKQWENLLGYATTLASHYPTDTDALVYMARAHLWLNHKNLARDAYVKVLNRIPGHLEATAFLKQ